MGLFAKLGRVSVQTQREVPEVAGLTCHEWEGTAYLPV